MKKATLVILLSTILVVSLTASVVLSEPVANAGADAPGPAPNSGDCIPDGSGLDPRDCPGKGPAPNSGDGIPDGSGF